MPLIPAQQGGATYSQPGFLAQSSSSHVELLCSQLSSPAPACSSPPPVTPGTHAQVCVCVPGLFSLVTGCFHFNKLSASKSLSMFSCWLHSCSSQVCVSERTTLDVETLFQPCISWLPLKWQRKCGDAKSWECSQTSEAEWRPLAKSGGLCHMQRYSGVLGMAASKARKNFMYAIRPVFKKKSRKSTKE